MGEQQTASESTDLERRYTATRLSIPDLDGVVARDRCKQCRVVQPGDRAIRVIMALERRETCIPLILHMKPTKYPWRLFCAKPLPNHAIRRTKHECRRIRLKRRLFNG